MLKIGDSAPPFELAQLGGERQRFETGRPSLLIFFESDCPTCHLTLPYLNKLALSLDGAAVSLIGISQDDPQPTRELIEQLSINFPIVLDQDLSVSRQYDPQAVPTLFLIDADGKIARTEIGFDKEELNAIAASLLVAAGRQTFTLADAYDGAPIMKPGCTSRHLETPVEGELAATPNVYAKRGHRASRIELGDNEDAYDYMMRLPMADPLPVIPPTIERVERMLAATALAPDEVVAYLAPNYGAATVEKIAANAVMAGCAPAMMSVLITLVQAASDERFNLHGAQATTHFAAPLIILNGEVRQRLGFASGGNVMSNVARANSTVGRAFQLILTNIGGARAGEIDMSTLGNPGKFSYCIAENEEENPWSPLSVEMGFAPGQSTVTLFAAEAPRGVSEHYARDGKQILKALSRALATAWTYRQCAGIEALVVLCPEHVKTLQGDGFTKETIREWLFANTGIPKRDFENVYAEGVPLVSFYKEAVIEGEPCYLKFPDPQMLKIMVAGGTAGKFSAVVNSWVTGPRGSQMVTYPIRSES